MNKTLLSKISAFDLLVPSNQHCDSFIFSFAMALFDVIAKTIAAEEIAKIFMVPTPLLEKYI